MTTTEVALGQILSDGEWLDFARATPEEAFNWAGGHEDRRVVFWIGKHPLVPRQANQIKVGDTILWDGEKAEVTHAQLFRTAMLPGYQVELMVRGTGFVASNVTDAGDLIVVIDKTATE